MRAAVCVCVCKGAAILLVFFGELVPTALEVAEHAGKLDLGPLPLLLLSLTVLFLKARVDLLEVPLEVVLPTVLVRDFCSQEKSNLGHGSNDPKQRLHESLLSTSAAQ